jgi:DNA-binding CsgD family transcriptional regulator
VTGNAPLTYAPLTLAVWRGQETLAFELIEAATEAATTRGEGAAIGFAEYAAAVLYNGVGRYQEALSSAQRAERNNPTLLGLALVELVEAAARSGAPEQASDAMSRLEESTSAAGTDWALGVRAQSRALLLEGQSAEILYREAIERLAGTREVAHLARAHLLYGEWLRRENRRVDARRELRAAYDMLSRMGAEAFAERARAELQATGETVRKRSEATRYDLTPQEAQIGRLADEGLTNSEIGAKLFLSPRTVEWHLGKVFAKLGISSRRELHRALSAAEATSQA